MTEGYGSHYDFMDRTRDAVDARKEAVEIALRKAFSPFIRRVEVEVIDFSAMSALDLAKSILEEPLILKPLLTCCNIAGRAIERDLGIRNLDTYAPRISESQITAIAGYLKPFLPSLLELPAIIHLDKVSFIDKEVRKSKGQWERSILQALNHYSQTAFRKRKFVARRRI